MVWGVGELLFRLKHSAAEGLQRTFQTFYTAFREVSFFFINLRPMIIRHLDVQRASVAQGRHRVERQVEVHLSARSGSPSFSIF